MVAFPEAGMTCCNNCDSLRRSKAALLETDVPKLEKLIRKGKNLTKTVLDDRMAKVCQPHVEHHQAHDVGCASPCSSRSSEFQGSTGCR